MTSRRVANALYLAQWPSLPNGEVARLSVVCSYYKNVTTGAVYVLYDTLHTIPIINVINSEVGLLIRVFQIPKQIT